MSTSMTKEPFPGAAAGDARSQPGLPVVDLQAEPESQPTVEIADLIIRLVRTWGNLKARMVATVDPEIGSLILVGRLVKEGPARAKDLAEATCADQSTVSRQVAALVKAGLIERQADPDDGRASLLVPTALGVARVEKHFANRGRALEPLMADWTAADRHQFLRLLSRFTTTLEARRDDVASAIGRSHHSYPTDLPSAAAPSEQGRHVPSANPEIPHQQPEPVQPHARTERSN